VSQLYVIDDASWVNKLFAGWVDVVGSGKLYLPTLI
jgi:hypothetical protein